ncbi:prostaglandin E2 receptor EP2 subtype [Dermochelys coriacea]|uniref:prostaglandin E2 receptor EP2 subtype n=1 Tax=Dermochelys coriacea TaxID=27794 RepID=UPI0018E74D00|nr:prostaglandin E2 receptor EP2 subtype [Dermochelys coriacea]
MPGAGSDQCYEGQKQLAAEESPAISAVMFSAGLLGNLTALALLARRRLGRRGRPLSLFHWLVTVLVLTDLLGTCLVSPVVLASYGRNHTLMALAEGQELCRYFAFAMSFFGLATMLVLFAMALERCLALGQPYLYERLASRRSVLRLALPALSAFAAAAFCALPLLGFGSYVQYCPGTWCFIQMRLGRAAKDGAGGGDTAYSLLYATLLLLLILAVLLCNLSVIRNLVGMHRRGQTSRRLASLEQPAGRRRLSVSEEVDHLILLAIMTITFIVCSLPFTIRAYMNKFMQKEDYKKDLLALRFLAINPIIDPWVFVILRPSVLRVIRSVLCCQMSLKTQDNMQTTPAAESKSNKQIDLCGQ